MSLTSFKRGNPCPICNSDNGGCKEIERQRGNTILCLNERSTTPDYTYAGECKKNNAWGEFNLTADLEAWTEEEQREWKEQREQKRIQQEREWEARQAESLSADERDIAYRQLLPNLTLDPSDRADLIRRGLSDLQIEQYGFKSVEKWQSAHNAPLNLPGVLPHGSLNTPEPGYLCPITDIQGRIVGCQVRSRDPQAQRKYYWQSSHSQEKRPTGQKPHLKGTDENPLTFIGNVENAYKIAFVEGVGAKPLITHLRLGILVIGAAGGQFAQGKGQIVEALQLAPNAKWILYADAGSRNNPHIVREYTRLATLLHSYGRSLLIADWGQWDDKSAGDIDEIENHSDIRFHPFSEFTRAKGFAPQQEAVNPDVAERDRAITHRQHRFRKFWGDLQKDFRLSNSKTRTINIYEGYAPTFELDTKTILLRGWLGSGKTEAAIKSLVPHKDKQIVWISGRNGLLRQTAERLHKLGFDVNHFQDDPGLNREMLRDEHPGVFLLCPDSLKDYAVKHCDWKNTIFVLDEFSGIRREVLGKTEIMPEFERLLAESHTLIAIDAFLGDVDARIISRYRPGARAIYDQVFSQSQKPIQWLETRTKDGKISMSHDGIQYGLLREWVEAGHRIAIASDTKRDAKLCAQFLRRLGVKVLLCHSETVESNQRLLHDPDRYLAESDAQVLIYSPTAQSGLDVQTRFDRGLALYSGVISPLDFLQMIGRGRKVEQWSVSAPRRSLDPNCLVSSLDGPKVLKMGEKLQQSFTDLEIESSAKTRGWGLWQGITKEIEKSFHSEYLQQLLIHFFESVETVEVECDRSIYKADSKAIKQEETVLTLSGNLANGQQMIRNQKAPSTDAEVWDIALAEQFDRYPKIWNLLLQMMATDDEESKQWAIEFAIVASSPRIKKLEHWVSATSAHAGEDLQALQDQVKRRFTSYVSPTYKTLQFRTLFQELGLESLAKVKKDDPAIAHKTHFRNCSTRIGELWTDFQRSPRLTKLFPFVETQTEFFAIVKRCMSFHGYQSGGKTIRQRSEELHPNGNDRHGKPRLSSSQSVWFVGWLIMEESGNKLFQEHFEWIIEAISDRLNLEREKRRQYQEGKHPPPLAA
ncbi:hypothetical protein AB3R30_25265 [Leptolyngbyaceae cyanobacterium UHCC 1019]